MEVNEIIEVLQAYKAGKTIVCRYQGVDGQPFTKETNPRPSWIFLYGYSYEIKEPKLTRFVRVAQIKHRTNPPTRSIVAIELHKKEDFKKYESSVYFEKWVSDFIEYEPGELEKAFLTTVPF